MVARVSHIAWTNETAGRHIQGRQATIKALSAPLQHPRPYGSRVRVQQGVVAEVRRIGETVRVNQIGT